MTNLRADDALKDLREAADARPFLKPRGCQWSIAVLRGRRWANDPNFGGGVDVNVGFVDDSGK